MSSSAPVFSQARPTAHDRLHWYAELIHRRARVVAALAKSNSYLELIKAQERLGDALRGHGMWMSHVRPVSTYRRTRWEYEAARRWVRVWTPDFNNCPLNSAVCTDCKRVVNRFEALAVLQDELDAELEVPRGH